MASTQPAFVHWDAQWRTEDGRSAWMRPEPEVIAAASDVLARGGSDALDVGCGVGRHALALARMGMASHGVDMSQAGLDFVREAGAAAGLDIHLRQAPMTALPYPDDSFDLVVAWNVVYHGMRHEVAKAIDEVCRVLRPGGRYVATMLSTRNAEHGRGRSVESGVFVQDDATDDKIHPHFYCDLADLVRLHPTLAGVSAADVEHAEPGSFHWHVVFESPLEPDAAGAPVANPTM